MRLKTCPDRALVRKKTDAGSVRDGLQPGGATAHWSGVDRGPKDNVDLDYIFYSPDIIEQTSWVFLEDKTNLVLTLTIFVISQQFLSLKN